MLIIFMDDFIFVDAQFFFAPSEEHEPLGKAVSISFVDKYPNFEHKAKILKNFDKALGQRQLTDFRLIDMRYNKQLVAREWA